jgi:hypothetical protein
MCYLEMSTEYSVVLKQFWELFCYKRVVNTSLPPDVVLIKLYILSVRLYAAAVTARSFSFLIGIYLFGVCNC